MRILTTGGRALVYFDQKLGGEISVRATTKSPEMAFDITLVELHAEGEQVRLGKFAILEVQTMDFHGSYGGAVEKLSSALSLHPTDFAEALSGKQWWAGDGIEGPNIANVFKRTFYQMVFKFGFAASEHCVGTALTIPQSVWDSWKPFLANPTLERLANGTHRVIEHGSAGTNAKRNTWIYVVDLDSRAPSSPSPLSIKMEIQVSAEQLAALAIEDAPRAAEEELLGESGIYKTLRRRLRTYFPGIETLT